MSNRNVDWLGFLIDHLRPQDVRGLELALEGEKAIHSSVPARLLGFYIMRERAAIAEGNMMAQKHIDWLDQAIATAKSKAILPNAGSSTQKIDPAYGKLKLDTMEPSEAVTGIHSAHGSKLSQDFVDKKTDLGTDFLINDLNLSSFIKLMNNKGEPKESKSASEVIAPDLTDGEFILALYALILGRGCNGYELEAVRSHLESGAVTRDQLLSEYFVGELSNTNVDADVTAPDDELSCWLMGTKIFPNLADWQRKARDKDQLAGASSKLQLATPFTFRSEPGVEITCIASLYCGGDFIEQFMDNITSQDCFDRHCELIIIDAASLENESEIIARYLDRHPSVRYQRMQTRVGIYEAWNIGVKMSRGQYLTNTNLDDLRRRDSLAIQAGALEALPFADVVYQDVYYTFDPKLDWKSIAAFGYKSELPIVTPHNLLRFNSPHNAPMWRRTLHDELGLFDESLRSAGDYEFWMRCLAAGKVFYKINEPHVVYYQNPNGLSTRPDTRGVVEANAIRKKYARILQARSFTGNLDEFIFELQCDDIPAETLSSRNRYVIAQAALRSLGRKYKKGRT